MIGKRVVVVYASKYGSTEEISQAIGETFRKRGLRVDVVSVDKEPSLADAALVIAGSPIYAGRVRSSLAGYFEAHRAQLAERDVALFAVSASVAEDPEANRPAVLQALAPLGEGLGIVARGVFGGVLDLRKLPLPSRLLVKAMKAKTGDFRDWDAISVWSQALADKLTA